MVTQDHTLEHIAHTVLQMAAHKEHVRTHVNTQDSTHDYNTMRENTAAYVGKTHEHNMGEHTWCTWGHFTVHARTHMKINT